MAESLSRNCDGNWIWLEGESAVLHHEWAERPDLPVDEGDWRWGLWIDFVSDMTAAAVDEALRSTDGVKRAVHFDREAWEIIGQFSGEELLNAVADAVQRVMDQIAERSGRHDG